MLAPDTKRNRCDALLDNICKVMKAASIVKDQNRLFFNQNAVVRVEVVQKVVVATRSRNVEVVNPSLQRQLSSDVVRGNNNVLLALLHVVKVNCTWPQIDVRQSRLVITLEP